MYLITVWVFCGLDDRYYQEYALCVDTSSEFTVCLTDVSATSLSVYSLAKLQSGPGGESGKHSFILRPKRRYS
jgi:hypothetical protein